MIYSKAFSASQAPYLLLIQFKKMSQSPVQQRGQNKLQVILMTQQLLLPL